MESTGIYYFSGTGNCFAIAKQISQEFDNAKTIAITDKFIEINSEINHANCIVIYPAYAYGMPSILYKFFKQIKIKCGYLAAIVSYGSRQGGALLHAKRLCKKQRGKQIDYLGKIKSVENYIPIFGLKPENVLKNLVEDQSSITNDVIKDLKEKAVKTKVWGFRPFSAFISWLFRNAKWLFARGYKVTDDCIKCGLCRDICPAGAIEMENGEKPNFVAKKCEHCQGCLNWCPKRAINYIRLHPKSRRYTHPDITISEMRKEADDFGFAKKQFTYEEAALAVDEEIIDNYNQSENQETMAKADVV